MTQTLTASQSIRLLVFACLLPLISVAAGETVRIQLDPSRVRDIGGITRFDRDQFITIHEGPGSGDLSAENRRYLEDELDVRYGRDGGSLSSQAKRIKASPNNPDMPDIAAIEEAAQVYKSSKSGQLTARPEMRNLILCTHPEHMHAMAGNHHAEWGPRTYEGVAEFTARFLKCYFTDENRPRYLEVFNEPFVKAKKIGTTIEALSEQHNVVAKRVRELNPDVLVGGYSAAWVELESRNFGHWDGWQKKFMDIAGANMDFFSYHIYDGVNVTGSPRDRTGSNSEAIMDLIDTYSHIKFGVAKPIMITEYGKIPEGGMEPSPYSPARSAAMLYSLNGQLMTYMDHPDRLLRVIPFILGKGSWTYSFKSKAKPGEANCFLLWRKDADGTFVETDLTLFYKFWHGVSGEWRESRSSDPDVRVHLLADGDRLVVALANLDHAPKQLDLHGLENLDAETVGIRTLQTDGEAPVLSEEPATRIPASIELGPGMGAQIWIKLKQPVPVHSLVKEHRIYATEHLKDIVAEQPMRFSFIKVPTGPGTAILRISPGRELGRQVLPSSIIFNGKPLPIPTNWAGDDQAGRSNFFGMIEVPVPAEILAPNSTLEITYPDTGGKLACAVLQVNLTGK